jgi:hypothetical protein
VWIEGLPLEYDLIEAPKTHALLCELISSYVRESIDYLICYFSVLVRYVIRVSFACIDLMLRFGADIMGPDWCNFPNILTLFGKILQSPKKDELVAVETLALFKHILLTLPLELLFKGMLRFLERSFLFGYLA